ncbi:hypothetical protein DPMN_028261 [Dreissena polymorpha]|uniref:Uncharacterized protein n=1 Tax=Dreissena polymorpha TaxID=45954 RepID=A0A9D4LUE8_DREPO|nr:hypothetical protein DPMN_028261 [Dreissena polymorpha]
MQIDDEHDEATSPMILETVDDKVYAPSTSAYETPDQWDKLQMVKARSLTLCMLGNLSSAKM